MRFQLLPGDDIFISYARMGAGTYASGLAEALIKRGFSPFVDKLDARPSPELTDELRSKIRECRMLVIIGTRRAGNRQTIGDEIKEYLGTGRRAIVAIDFNNAVEKARWYPLIKGISLEPEPRTLALKDGQPSESVLNRIEMQFTYTRSKVRQRRTTYALAALSLLFISVSIVAAIYAATRVAAAIAAQAEADRQTAIARSRRLASLALTHLDDQLDLALLLGAAAADAADTFEARRSLFSALNHSPYYNTFLGHEMQWATELSTTSYSLNGQRIAAAGADATIRVWDVVTKRALGEPLRHPDSDPLRAIALSPDGRTLASGTCRHLFERRGSVTLWDLDRRAVKGSLDDGSVGAVTLEFSPDGRHLAAVGCDGVVSVWDLAASPPVRHQLIRYHFKGWPAVFRLAFSHDNKLLATGGDVEAITIWDVEKKKSTGEELSTPDNDTTSLAFDPYRDRLAIGRRNGGIALWDYTTKVQKAGVKDPCAGVRPTRAFGSEVRLPRASNGSAVLCYTLTDTGVSFHAVRAISFPDKNHIRSVSAGRELIFWRVGDDSAAHNEPKTEYAIVNYFVLKGHKGGFDSVSIGSNHVSCITVDADGSVVFWELLPNIAEAVEELPLEVSTKYGNPTRIVAHPDAKQHTLAIGFDTGAILFWDSAGRQEMNAIREDRHDPVVHLAYDRSGEHLASVDQRGLVTIWDANRVGKLSTFTVVRQLRPSDVPSRIDTRRPVAGDDVAFDSELRTLAVLSSSDAYTTITLWETAGTLLSQLDLRIRIGLDVTVRMAFNPRGRTLAVSHDAALTLWDVSDPRSPHKLAETEQTANQNTGIRPLVFSHDGALLAAPNIYGEVFIRSADTLNAQGRSLTVPDRLAGSPLPVSGSSAVTFSPDDRTIVSAGELEDVLSFWDVGSREFIGEIRSGGFQRSIASIAYGANGGTLATVFKFDQRSHLLFWKLDTPTLKRIARRIANRSLSAEEMKNTD